MQNPEIQLVSPSLDLAICLDADTCAAELTRCADEADRCAALAQAGAELAIRHAWNAGAVCLKAKELIAHGEFQAWLEASSGGRDIRTMQRYMKLAKTTLESFLADNPTLKGLQDAYVAAGVLPEAEPKQDTGEGEKVKPLFVLNFKTEYKHVSEWQPAVARDFLYEFDRIAKIAMQLKTEFGL